MTRRLQLPQLPRLPSVAGWRDTALFLAGLYLARNEFVLRDQALPERPFTIAVICTLLGLPVFLRSDEHRQGPKPPAPPAVEPGAPPAPPTPPELPPAPPPPIADVPSPG